MTNVEFYDNGTIVKGILLGKYQRPHDEVYPYEKKFLWVTKRIYKHRTLNSPLYAIFIPWKHREKEIVEIDEKYIINHESLSLDEDFIEINHFISKPVDAYNVSHLEMEVNNFVGYPFMYEHNSFMINLALQDNWDNLTTLYENIPEVLEVDLNNAEE